MITYHNWTKASARAPLVGIRASETTRHDVLAMALLAVTTELARTIGQPLTISLHRPPTWPPRECSGRLASLSIIPDPIGFALLEAAERAAN